MSHTNMQHSARMSDLSVVVGDQRQSGPFVTNRDSMR